MLGAIYPIEDFLKDGQSEIKIRKNRQTGKESKLKLSERRFMRAVGMGVVREDSGQNKEGQTVGQCALQESALAMVLYSPGSCPEQSAAAIHLWARGRCRKNVPG